MYPEGQRDLPAKRPPGGFEDHPTSRRTRAVILEPHTAVRVVLEYLMSREGFEVEALADEGRASAVSGPALMLVAAGDGLYVFNSGDAKRTLGDLDGVSSFEAFSGVTGIQAFVPKPFGAEDVLRVVRAVRGFDGRRRPRSRTA